MHTLNSKLMTRVYNIILGTDESISSAARAGLADGEGPTEIESDLTESFSHCGVSRGGFNLRGVLTVVESAWFS